MPVGPSPSLIERLMGKRKKDIELPNESGEIDPRLTRTQEGIKKAMKGFKQLNKQGLFKDKKG